MVATRSPDAEMRLPKIFSIRDAEGFHDLLRTETLSGANDRRTAIDIRIIRFSMDAQGATVRWVDHSGMYGDAMRKRSCNIPLLQIFLGAPTITEMEVWCLVLVAHTLVKVPKHCQNKTVPHRTRLSSTT